MKKQTLAMFLFSAFCLLIAGGCKEDIEADFPGNNWDPAKEVGFVDDQLTFYQQALEIPVEFTYLEAQESVSFEFKAPTAGELNPGETAAIEGVDYVLTDKNYDPITNYSVGIVGYNDLEENGLYQKTEKIYVNFLSAPPAVGSYKVFKVVLKNPSANFALNENTECLVRVGDFIPNPQKRVYFTQERLDDAYQYVPITVQQEVLGATSVTIDFETPTLAAGETEAVYGTDFTLVDANGATISNKTINFVSGVKNASIYIKFNTSPGAGAKKVTKVVLKTVAPTTYTLGTIDNELDETTISNTAYRVPVIGDFVGRYNSVVNTHANGGTRGEKPNDYVRLDPSNPTSGIEIQSALRWNRYFKASVNLLTRSISIPGGQTCWDDRYIRAWFIDEDYGSSNNTNDTLPIGGYFECNTSGVVAIVYGPWFVTEWTTISFATTRLSNLDPLGTPSTE